MTKPIFIREIKLTYGPLTGVRRSTIKASDGAAELLREVIGSNVQESFVVIPLDARQRPLGWYEVGRGTATTCPVSPADVLRVPLLCAAPAMVIGHNHPSGDPTPSPEDIELTRRLVEGAKLIGIKILDHVIIAEEGRYSFLDSGLMPK